MPSKLKKENDLQVLPLDRNVALQLRLILSRSLVGAKTSNEDEKIKKYTTTQAGKEISWHFDKTLANNLEQKLRKTDFDHNYSLGLRSLRTIYSMIYFSARYGSGLEGHFTISQLMALWGTNSKDKKGGRNYKELENTIVSLGSLTLCSKRLNDGKELDMAFRPLFAELIIQGHGSKRVISYEFNKKALGSMAYWLESEQLDRTVFTNGYLSMPTSDFKDTNIDPKYDAFRERLRNLKPGLITVNLSTILIDWIFATDDFLRRKSKSLELMDAFFKQAIEEGHIKDTKRRFSDEEKKWLNAYQYTILK